MTNLFKKKPFIYSAVIVAVFVLTNPGLESFNDFYSGETLGTKLKRDGRINSYKKVTKCKEYTGRSSNLFLFSFYKGGIVCRNNAPSHMDQDEFESRREYVGVLGMFFEI